MHEDRPRRILARVEQKAWCCLAPVRASSGVVPAHEDRQHQYQHHQAPATAVATAAVSRFERTLTDGAGREGGKLPTQSAGPAGAKRQRRHQQRQQPFLAQQHERGRGCRRQRR